MSLYTVHTLKTHPAPFTAILKHEKSFELRKNDRNFQLGDDVRLLEWDPDTRAYTGFAITVRITYLIKDTGPFPGLMPGFCVFGFQVLVTEFGPPAA